MVRLKTIISLCTGCLVIPFVSAQSMGDLNAIVGIIDMVFSLVKNLFKSEYFIYGATLILYYLLFFNIFKAGFQRVSIFSGEGAVGLSGGGKAICHALTGLLIISLFAFLEPSQWNIFVRLAQFGVLGEIVIIGLTTWLIYHVLRSDRT